MESAESIELASPEPGDFEDARRNEPSCLILGEGRTFVALRAVPDFPDTFLYAARQIDPFAVEFPAQAIGLISLYEAYDSHRRNILIAFTTMYVLLALVFMLSATWTGLSFANRLVTPIRRLMAATNQVSAGNLYVQVPVNRREGDLATLGDTFNQMTSELRLQQNRIVAATQTLEERRAFTEAVLAGVPAAVVGVARTGRVTVVNPSAAKLVSDGGGGRRSDRPQARRRSSRTRAHPRGGASAALAHGPRPDHAEPRRAGAALRRARRQLAGREGGSELRAHPRRHHRSRDRAAHVGLGRRRPSHRA